jgi:hypothetical protein
VLLNNMLMLRPFPVAVATTTGQSAQPAIRWLGYRRCDGDL